MSFPIKFLEVCGLPVEGLSPGEEVTEVQFHQKEGGGILRSSTTMQDLARCMHSPTYTKGAVPVLIVNKMKQVD